MDMGDGSAFIDEINNTDLFGQDGDGASGFEWADEILSSSESGEKVHSQNALEGAVVHNTQQLTGQLVGQASSLNVQYIQSTTNTTVQQATVQQIPQPQILPSLSNLQSGGQLIQGVNGQIFLKPLPNGQFQLSTQPQIQQLQHPQQSSSPIPLQPHVSHVNILQPSQSPIPISSPHVGSSSSSSASPHVSRSITPIQQSRQYQNVNMLQLPTGSQSQQQILRNLPITSQISNIGGFQTHQIIPSQSHVISNQGQILSSQGHGQGQGQNFVNTQNTVIQNPNVVNVNVAHVLCPNQFQGQQGQSIQGTLIQTADGKNIIIPSSQLSNNQIQIQNVPQVLQPLGGSSNTTGTTPLVQGGQVVENNAAALGGLGYIRIAASSSSGQDQKIQNIQPQQPTHILGINQQGQQILIQRAPNPNQNIILRQVAPQNIFQLPQTQTPSSNQILPQTSQQSTQQILLPQVQRLVTGPQGQQQVKLVAPTNLQTGNMPMTLNIGGQNIILPSNFQQILQQQNIQAQANQVQKSVSSETFASGSSTGLTMSKPQSSRSSTTPISFSSNTVASNANFNQNNQSHPNVSQMSSFFMPQQVTSSTASMTPITTTVSQTKQSIQQMSMSNSPKVYQAISSVDSNVTTTSMTQKPFLSAVTNAPKLPMTTIQLTPQAQQQIAKIQTEIKKLTSLKDPNDQQKQQLNNYREGLKQLIAKGQIRIQSAQPHVVQQAQPQIVQQAQPQIVQQAQPQIVQPASSLGQMTTISQSFIGQPSVNMTQPGSLVTTSSTALGTIQNSSTGNQIVGTTNQNVFLSQATGAFSGLVSSDATSTRSVQSQSGTIMSISPSGSKPTQPIVIQAPVTSTVLVTSQTGSGDVQGGQQSSLNLLVQSSASGTPIKGTVPGKLPISANPQVAVPTQIKIANHILTLNLTPDQKEKVQGYLTKMPIEQQQQQMALFLKLQQQQKLNAQVQAQIEHQKRIQTGQTTNIQSQLPLTVTSQLATTTTATTGSIIIEQPGSSPNRPNIIQRVSVAAIPKHQLIHQQLGKDQSNALMADTKTPFRNQRDTYRRLLRYHVFQTKNPPDHLVKKDDEMFDDLAEGLVKKKNWMFEKYRSLLLEESTRKEQTAEVMMIQKMLNEDLKEVLDVERKTVKRNPDEFEPMPWKYLRLGSQQDDDLPETKFDPSSVQIKQEKFSASSPLPHQIKKENSESGGSRPSTPKLKLVLKSDGQGYSSSFSQEVMDVAEPQDNQPTDFMSRISVKEEQVDVEENTTFSDNEKPFNSYVDKSRNFSNISDDPIDNGAESDSDVTVVSEGDNKIYDPIVIDEDDDDQADDSSHDHQDEEMCSPESLGDDPVIKHEDISSDFTDFFSNKYPSGSSELSFYTKPSHDVSHDILPEFPHSEPISNDIAYSQNSDAQSTRTIPYSEDGNSIKDEDLNDDIDYNRSTSSYAHYEPISSPEAEQNDSSISNYLNSFESSSAFNARDQNLGFGMSNRINSCVKDEFVDSPPWTEEKSDVDIESADKIKAEMESAINSILSLN